MPSLVAHQPLGSEVHGKTGFRDLDTRIDAKGDGMRRLFASLAAAALVAISTTGASADPAELGTRFTGTLAFGACPADPPDDLDAPRVIEPFTDLQVTVSGRVFDFEGRIIRGHVYEITDFSGVVVPGAPEELDW